jgi:hypothetical protein
MGSILSHLAIILEQPRERVAKQEWHKTRVNNKGTKTFLFGDIFPPGE